MRIVYRFLEGAAKQLPPKIRVFLQLALFAEHDEDRLGWIKEAASLDQPE